MRALDAFGIARGAAWLAVAALCTASAAQAQQTAAKEDEGAIKYRQSLMSSIGGHMGGIANIAKYGLPFPTHVVVHAEALERSAALIPAAFERRAVSLPNDAKPEIWETPEEFVAKARKLEEEARKLAAIASDGDLSRIGPQLEAVGDACGDCHDSFRKPKEESYKRKGGGGGE